MLAGEGADDGVCLGCYSTGTEFGFNDPEFSDRILRVEVTRDRPESSLGKRNREEAVECDQEPHPQHSKGSSGCGVTSIHINSLVLASKSLFFYKMFSNGMRESYEQVVSLSVHDYEEGVVLDLLEFLYNNRLKEDTTEYLLKVLVLADKYQVAQCVTHCARKLVFIPMTLELALSCVNLPSNVLASDNTHLQSLVNKATSFLTKNFISESKAALELPLEVIEDILSWDALKVDCEDDVCDFVLEWARTHYKDLSERRQVLSSRLSPLVRWSHMSREKLKTVLQREELNQGRATLSKSTIQAPRPHRDYNFWPLKSIALDPPHKQCEVYLDVSKHKLTTLRHNSGRIRTRKFRVGGEWFYLRLRVDHVLTNHGSAEKLTVKLFRSRESSERSAEALMAEWEVAVRSRGSGEYDVERAMRPVSHFRNFKDVWCPIGGSWDSFVAEDSEYFIDGVFYLKVTVSIHGAIRPPWC